MLTWCSMCAACPIRIGTNRCACLPAVTEMFVDIRRFLDRWLHQYEANQRSYLTVAIGCTGGQHRSVFLAEQLHHTFASGNANVQLRHRDMGNDQA